MSPEQAAGERELHGRSDVSALGCVLYEMLAGHPPFMGQTAQEILARHSMDAVPRLSAARPTVPWELERAIATALAKTPADRFRTAPLFAEALEQHEPGAKPTVVAPAHRRVRALALLALARAIAGVLLVVRLDRGPSAPAEPEHQRSTIAVLPFHSLSGDERHA